MADNYFKVVSRQRIVSLHTFDSDELRHAERAYASAEAVAKSAGAVVVVWWVPEPFAGAPPFSLVRSATPCPPGCCLFVRDQPNRTRNGRPSTSRPGWTCTRCNRHRGARGSEEDT